MQISHPTTSTQSLSKFPFHGNDVNGNHLSVIVPNSAFFRKPGADVRHVEILPPLPDLHAITKHLTAVRATDPRGADAVTIN